MSVKPKLQRINGQSGKGHYPLRKEVREKLRKKAKRQSDAVRDLMNGALDRDEGHESDGES